MELTKREWQLIVMSVETVSSDYSYGQFGTAADRAREAEIEALLAKLKDELQLDNEGEIAAATAKHEAMMNDLEGDEE